MQDPGRYPQPGIGRETGLLRAAIGRSEADTEDLGCQTVRILPIHDDRPAAAGF